MNTKTLSAIGIGVLTLMTTEIYAQAPSPAMPKANQGVPQIQQQATQIQNQTQQNANNIPQNVTPAPQNVTPTPQNTATTTSTSFLDKAKAQVANIANVVNNLSPEQRSQLLGLFTNLFSKQSQNSIFGATDPAKQKTLDAAATQEKDEQVKKILTPEQYAALSKPAAPATKPTTVQNTTTTTVKKTTTSTVKKTTTAKKPVAKKPATKKPATTKTATKTVTKTTTTPTTKKTTSTKTATKTTTTPTPAAPKQ